MRNAVMATMAASLLAILATTAHAGQTVGDTTYNFTGTDWAAIDRCDRGTACNPLNGSDAPGDPGVSGEPGGDPGGETGGETGGDTGGGTG